MAGSTQDVLCSNCAALDLSLSSFDTPDEFKKQNYELDDDWDDYTELGPLQDIISRSDCPLCRLVTKITRDRGDEWTEAHVCWSREGCSDDGSIHRRHLQVGIEDGGPLLPRIMPFCDGEERLLQGRQIGDQIDFAKIRQWMNCCDEKHETSCHGSIESTMTRDNLIVIDCHELCLVPISSEENYVALSYVWGAKTSLQTVETNFPLFQQLKGLEPYLDDMGATIKDSIELVEAIGERYLWVDSLCIVQDNTELKLKVMSTMADIYQQAILVIIAASGSDCEAGLPGVRPHTRTGAQDVEYINQELSLTSVPDLVGFMEISVYRQRAWTYQEENLARRKLYFIGTEVVFQCFSSTWRESVASDDVSNGNDIESNNLRPFDFWPLYRKEKTVYPWQESDSDSHSGSDKGSDTGSDTDSDADSDAGSDMAEYETYQHVVESYTRRHLTHEEDILNAFTAIMKLASKALKTEILCGIPLISPSRFNTYILWDVCDFETRRRNGGFPSWSWCGWMGKITIPGVGGYQFWIDWHIEDSKSGIVKRIWDEDDELNNEPPTNEPSVNTSENTDYRMFVTPHIQQLLRFWTAVAKFKITDTVDPDDKWFEPGYAGFPWAAVLDRHNNLCGSAVVPKGVEIEFGRVYELAIIAGAITARRSLPHDEQMVHISDSYHGLGEHANDKIEDDIVDNDITDKISLNDVVEPVRWSSVSAEDFGDPFYEAWILTPRNGSSEIVERLASAFIFKKGLRRAFKPGVEWRELVIR